MNVLKIAALAAAMSLGAAGAANAAQQSFTQCLTGIWLDQGPNQGLAVNLGFTSFNYSMELQANGWVVGGGIAYLTPQQIAANATTLDMLRTAAATAKKVNVIWDDQTKQVKTFIVRWNQPC